MSYRFERGFNPMMRFSSSSAVKAIIIANFAVYIFGLLLKLPDMNSGTHFYSAYIYYLSMVPEAITSHFYVWQFFTAMFMHAGFMHIAFNMLGLFFFGPELERVWGKKRFVKVYLAIGIAANIFAYILSIHSPVPTLGASGAVLGVLGAYAALYPNVEVIFFIFPLKVKYLVLLYFIMSFLGVTGLEGGGGGVSHSAHFAGIVLGVLYVMGRFRRFDDLRHKIKEKIRIWRIKRKYRNFRVVDSEVKQMWDELEDKINDDGRNKHIN